MANQQKNNVSVTFNILAACGKGGTIMRALFLVAVATLALSGCDEADNDDANGASTTVVYAALVDADINEDIGFNDWLEKPTLSVILRPDGESTTTYPGNLTVNTTLMTLTLDFVDIKPGVYSSKWFGVPDCVLLRDEGGNEVREIVFGKEDGELDGGLVSNDKVFSLIPDPACIDPDVVIPDGGVVDNHDYGDLDLSVFNPDGDLLTTEDCEVFIGVGSTPTTPAEEAPETSEGIFFVHIPANTYPIKVECGALTGEGEVAIYATSAYTDDDETPFAQVDIYVDESPADGTFCTKLDSYAIGTNQMSKDMSDQIGEYQSGFCVAYDDTTLLAVTITLNGCPDALALVSETPNPDLDQLVLEYTIPDVDGGVGEIEEANCSMDVTNGTDTVPDVEIAIRNDEIF